MEQVELLVRLKIPDVTALTASGALRRRMGYGETLKSLKRADYYRFDVEAPDAASALALVSEIAEKTNLFVNPNKHVFEVRSGGHEASAGSGAQVAQVLVTDPGDGSAQGALEALAGRLGYGESVRGLLRGVLWTLELDAPDADIARRMAQEIAVTRRREQGLLMNPHFQECEVW